MKFLWSAGGDVGRDVLAAPNMNGVPEAIKNGARWAADLGCLDGPEFVKRCDIDEARQWLFETMKPYNHQCIFVTVPDIVGDAGETYVTFEGLRMMFWGWPLAYVAQDDAEHLLFPPCCETIFIGGSTEWKLSAGAADVIQRGLAIDKHIHIGRVNWRKRYNHFRVMKGSESFTCDGTRMRYGRDKTLREWPIYEAQQVLFHI